MSAAAALVALAGEGAVPLWDRDRVVVAGPVSLATAMLVARSERSLGALVRTGGTLPLCVSEWPPHLRARWESAVAALSTNMAPHTARAAAETALRVAHAQRHVSRLALAEPPEADAVAPRRSGSGPHRRP
jgi:hypothetical protein